MKTEQWQELDRLFHSALERKPEERAVFLDQACEGDDSLRRQLEALLAAHEGAGSFIDRPAFEVEARSVANDERELAAGQMLGHYRIVSQLGAGGMGEVYLAEDTTLERQVALKLLPDDFTSDPDRVRRFQQEARAASGLNHPNIVTIHEIGQADGRHFITTEFIDGETLRQYITRVGSRITQDVSGKSATPLPLPKVLNIVIQTADALAAAHEAGIVHRDIKPENIMLRRRDGYVKVLDFGLAKLTERPAVAIHSEAPANAQIKTGAGVVMGTVNYMSPEQTRAEQVDARTDIWSLGVVAYELVAGCLPFQRSLESSPNEIIALILEREPPPLAHYAPEVPPELERIVGKALAKNREERYQTAKDLLIDLRRLKQRLEVEAELDRFATPELSSSGVTRDYAQATPEPPTARTDAGVVRRTSSAEYFISEIKQHKRGIIAGVMLLLIIAAGGGYVLYRVLVPRPREAPPQSIKRLTENGKVTAAVISPDGNYVAYSVKDKDKQSLWLKQTKASTQTEIVAPAEADFMGLTFSRDGNSIYYTARPPGTGYAALYEVPSLGGTPRKVVDGVFGPVTLSPDGKRVAFLRSVWSLLVVNVDGTGERLLEKKQGSAKFTSGPAWSPDGRTIVCGATVEPDNFYESLLEVPVDGGNERWITSHKWYQVCRTAWLMDGSGLIVVARDTFASGSQILHISYATGEMQRITTDLNSYGDNDYPPVSLSLTADSSALVAVQQDFSSRMWVTAIGDDESRARQISNGKLDGRDGVSWTPEGKILCVLKTGDDPDIWLMNPDGTERKQLTANAFSERWPQMSPDGRYIVFDSDRSGLDNIWRIDVDGSHPKQLTYGPPGDGGPRFTSDGQWVVFWSFRWAGPPKIGKVWIDGGDPVQLTDYFSFWPVLTPDGTLIASSSGLHLRITPATGGQPLKVLNVPPNMRDALRRFGWSADGKAITYIAVNNDVANIWSLPIDGGLPKELTHFKSDIIFAFALSPDGRQLVLARGTQTSDAILIRDFR